MVLIKLYLDCNCLFFFTIDYYSQNIQWLKIGKNAFFSQNRNPLVVKITRELYLKINSIFIEKHFEANSLLLHAWLIMPKLYSVRRASLIGQFKNGRPINAEGGHSGACSSHTSRIQSYCKYYEYSISLCWVRHCR